MKSKREIQVHLCERQRFKQTMETCRDKIPSKDIRETTAIGAIAVQAECDALRWVLNDIDSEEEMLLIYSLTDEYHGGFTPLGFCMSKEGAEWSVKNFKSKEEPCSCGNTKCFGYKPIKML